jgi:tyrosine-protein phosphatase SIW14
MPASAPVPLTVAGVGNFHQVNEHIYRGAQPTTAGFQGLAKLGVKTIIDLREADGRSALEKKAVEATGMRYINIPLRGMSAPSAADVEKIMALFNDDSAGPVFVHCRRGADRTGTVVACYRIAHDGWDNAKALQEAKTDGMSRIEIAMQHYVMNYHAPVASAAASSTAQQ